MLYVKVDENNGLPLDIKTHLTSDEHFDMRWKSRGDWKDFDTVKRLALYITFIMGKVYLPVDEMESIYPRYDIIEAPKVGDKIFRYYNGDLHPEGEITKITKKWRIETSTGVKFNRFKNTSSWREIGTGHRMVHENID
jgi:hypothetical protein